MRQKLAKRSAVPDAEAVYQVFQWIIQGQSEHDIQQAIAQKWPAENSKPLIAAAVQQIVTAGDDDPSAILGWCLEAKRHLYREMLNARDFVGALAVVKSIESGAAR